MIEFLPEAGGIVVEDSQPLGLVVPVARRWARRLVRRLRFPVRWGSLRRTEPLSSYYGFERGLPVDRFYVDEFLARNSEDIRGRVLEVRDGGYSRRFGAERVTDNEIVDIDEANPEATLIADLAEPGSLPAGHFDCVILTQTLQYLNDPEAALRNVWESLAPEGIALITVPCLSRIDADLAVIDRWRFTARGLETLLVRACPSAELEVTGPGNVLVGVAFLMGMAVDDLSQSELEHQDDHFPLVACARVRKPS